jgi:hypothetical protein
MENPKSKIRHFAFSLFLNLFVPGQRKINRQVKTLKIRHLFWRSLRPCLPEGRFAP